jgi:hypothetical protein
MKYNTVVEFIENYCEAKSFDKAIDTVIGLQINKERLDIYEKLLIYCPELTEKSKAYLADRIEKNKEMLSKREKQLKEWGMRLHKENIEYQNRKLDNYLEGTQEPANYGTITVDGTFRTFNEEVVNYSFRAPPEPTQHINITTDMVRAYYGTGMPAARQREIFETPEEIHRFAERIVGQDAEQVMHNRDLIRNGVIRLHPGQQYFVALAESGATVTLDHRGDIVRAEW